MQPIDRLEEKVKQLVGMIDTLRAERAQAVDEVGAARSASSTPRAPGSPKPPRVSAEAATLREERELIRNRVVQMIAQIDKLNL